MPLAYFCTDLHGRRDRYVKLWDAVAAERPEAVFLGGDLFPHAMFGGPGAFTADHFEQGWDRLRKSLGAGYPRVFLILGNDDPAVHVAGLHVGEKAGLWQYAHGRVLEWEGYGVLGYNCIPPSPFQLKDWERYDVSRFVDPGCLSPEEGRRTDGLAARVIRHTTIRDELAAASADADLRRTICLFHCPPYKCALDRAALDGKTVDHVPLDVHIGSVAIREFMESRRPLLGLHGHVHESTRLTGSWREEIGGVPAVNGAHDGRELALVRFDPAHPRDASRELL
ncbi:MAG: metallophosphoesterase [bacterium]